MARTLAGARTVVASRGQVQGRASTPSYVTPPPNGTPNTPPLPNAPVFGTITHTNLTDDGCTLNIPLDQGVALFVKWGTTNGGPYPNETVHETSFIYSTHVQRISGLAPGTTVYYKADATNAAAQNTVSAQGTFTTTGAVVSTFPPLATIGYTAPPAQSRPAFQTDTPLTGLTTEIRRITNTAGWGQLYPKQQPWSLDGTLLLLARSQRRLYRGDKGGGYGYLGQVPSGSSYNVWSNVYPRRLYGAQSGENRLRICDLTGVNTANTIAESVTGVTHGAWQTLYTFAGYNHIVIGNFEGNISDDDHLIALVGRTTGGVYHIIAFDPIDLVIRGTLTLSGDVNNCLVSRLGNYVLVQGSTMPQGAGQRLYNKDMTYVRAVNNDTGGHHDMGFNLAGEEVTVDVWSGRMHRLSDGQVTQILQGGANNALTEWGHVGMAACTRNGYALFSTTTTNVGKIGHDQIVAVKLDGSYQGNLFAYSHSVEPVGQQTYAAACHAAMSRNGDRVIFVSRWDGSATTQHYCFVAGMEV